MIGTSFEEPTVAGLVVPPFRYHVGEWLEALIRLPFVRRAICCVMEFGVSI